MTLGLFLLRSLLRSAMTYIGSPTSEPLSCFSP